MAPINKTIAPTVNEDVRDRTIIVTDANYDRKIAPHLQDGYVVISKVPIPDGFTVTLRHLTQPPPSDSETLIQQLRDTVEDQGKQIDEIAREKENLQGDLTRANNEIGQLKTKLEKAGGPDAGRIKTLEKQVESLTKDLQGAQAKVTELIASAVGTTPQK